MIKEELFLNFFFAKDLHAERTLQKNKLSSAVGYGNLL